MSSRGWVSLLVLLAIGTLAWGADDKATGHSNPVETHVQGVEIAAVVDGHNRFAWELYARLRKAPGNLVLSPLSLARALAILHAGAHGETADQIASVLHLPADSALAHRALSRLYHELSGDSGPHGVKLNSAGAVWACKGLGIPSEFSAHITREYRTTVSELDFHGDPGTACAAMNDWCRRIPAV